MDLFTDLGFSTLDIKILLLCPLFTAVGGFAHKPLGRSSIELKLTSGENWKMNLFRFMAFCYAKVCEWVTLLLHPPIWILGRLLLSGVTGLVIGFYFSGTVPLSPPPGDVARILATCIIIGYAAPKFWLAKKKWMLDVVKSDEFKGHLNQAIKEAVFEGKKKENPSSKVKDEKAS